MKEATKKVILRLKAVKEQKGLSCQDIVLLCIANNDSVSESTIRRICAKGSEDGADFRQYSIDAVFRAVVGTDDIKLSPEEEADLSAVEKETIAENAALKALVELRDAMISNMEKQIADLIQEKASLQKELEVATIRLETTNYMFKVAMESLGKSCSRE